MAFPASMPSVVVVRRSRETSTKLAAAAAPRYPTPTPSRAPPLLRPLLSHGSSYPPAASKLPVQPASTGAASSIGTSRSEICT